MREIGSEFNSCEFEQNDGMVFPDVKDQTLVFSGRTGIETIIKNTNIHKVLIPSYCCDSMLVPFRDNGIEYCFYNVYYDGGLKIDLSIPTDVDCVLWCNYFGFNFDMPDMSAFWERGGIIIEDITHSFLSKIQYHKQSTYLVASLRKWEPIISGGYCAGVKDTLDFKPYKKPNEEYIAIKNEAMKIKKDYLLNTDESLKSIFLDKFKIANSWLADNYSCLCIDDYSKRYLQTANTQKQKEQRIKNAEILYAGLKDNTIINPLFPLEKIDCPLFVPVIIDKNKRNHIRQELTDNKIYCPIHWPHPNAKCVSNLYDIELSLVCDQRYTEDDMQRIISVLDKYK